MSHHPSSNPYLHPQKVNDYYDPYKDKKQSCFSPRRQRKVSPQNMEQQSEKYSYYHLQNQRYKNRQRTQSQPHRQWPSCISSSMQKRIKEIIAERNKRINSNSSKKSVSDMDSQQDHRKLQQQRLRQKERIRSELQEKSHRRGEQIAAYHLQLGDYKMKANQHEKSQREKDQRRNTRRSSQSPQNRKKQQESRTSKSPIQIQNFNREEKYRYPIQGDQRQNSNVKIIKKSPSSGPKGQTIIKTTVEEPSSIATSILKNFQSNPDKLLKNMSDSKLEKVFLKF